MYERFSAGKVIYFSISSQPTYSCDSSSLYYFNYFRLYYFRVTVFVSLEMTVNYYNLPVIAQFNAELLSHFVRTHQRN